MKVFVFFMGLIIGTRREGVENDFRSPSAHLTRVETVSLMIKAYNATGKLDIRRDPFTLGTRILLTCDVSGLPEGNEAF